MLKSTFPLMLVSTLSIAAFCAPASAERFPAAQDRAGPDPEARGTVNVSRFVARHAEPRDVPEAVYLASRLTSVSYDFLLAQAQLESAMNPMAASRTSSARGLFQFINSTWLSTVKRHGGRFGLGRISHFIATAPDGTHHVPDARMRREILGLRQDPEIASLMAAALAEDNRAELEAALGRKPGHAELYLAHFLGAAGACRFLWRLHQDPSARAAAYFPGAASANRPIFFDRAANPRSLAQVMHLFDSKVGRALGLVRDRYAPGADYVHRINASFERAADPPPYLIVDETVFERVS